VGFQAWRTHAIDRQDAPVGRPSVGRVWPGVRGKVDARPEEDAASQFRRQLDAAAAAAAASLEPVTNLTTREVCARPALAAPPMLGCACLT
jgi:hypothetical protein